MIPIQYENPYWVIAEAQIYNTGTPPKNNGLRTNLKLSSFSVILAILASLALLVSVGGYFYFQAERDRLKLNVEDRLTAIEKLKVNQVENWLNERLSDARFIMSSDFFIEGIHQWLVSPDEVIYKRIIERLKAFESEYPYQDIKLVDPQGDLLLSLNNNSYISPEARGQVFASFKNGEPALVDFHFDDQGQPHLDIVAPLYYAGSSDKEPMVAVILAIDPGVDFNSIIRSWPLPDKTAEALIVRKEGNRVVFLNELKYQPGSALALSFPLSRTDIPAVMAVLGREGIFEGKDYSGEQVISILSPIPETPWYMIVKIDPQEALASVTYSSILILVLIFILVFVTAVIGVVFWQRNKRLHLQELLRLQTERQAILEQYEHVVKHAGDIIFLFNRDFRLVEANEKAQEKYGYSNEELTGLNLLDLVAPQEQALQSHQLQPGSGAGGYLFESLHKTRDGRFFPVEINSRMIRLQDGEYLQWIVRDISERKTLEAKLALNLDRIEHLNRVLRAIRNINQLISRQQDPQKLLREAVRELVETRGFSGSWIIHTDTDKSVTSFCESGWEGNGLTSAESSGVIDWCKCAATCLAENRLVTIMEQTENCGSCCLSARCHDAVIISSPLSFGARRYGVLAVTVEKKAFTEEDQELVNEITSDIAFALYTLETEASRRRLEQEARLYLDIAGVMIVVLDRKGRIKLVNRKAADILGYREGEMIGRDWFSLCIPDPDPVRAVFNRIMSGEIDQAEYYTNPVIARDGSLKTISWHNAVIKDESGNVTGTISSGEDIGLQQKAEQAFKDSEQNYRNSLDSSPLGIRIYDAENTTLYANRAFLEVYGVSSIEEFEAICTEERYSPESYRLFRERQEKGRKDEYISPVFEIAIKRKDGKSRNLQVNRKEVVWDGKQLIQAVYKDITEQSLAEEALKKSEIKYRSLVNNVKLGIFRSDPQENGKFLEVNPAMEEITGYSREELFSMPITRLYAHPEDRAGFMQRVIMSMDKVSGEFKFLKKDGTEIQVIINDIAIRDDSGKVIFIDGILDDITERKQAEARLLEVEYLRQSNKAKSELLANVSHELRTPLASIKGFIETLLEEDVKWSKDQQQDFLQSAIVETDRLTFLIRDLLDMSRLDSGKMVMDRKDYSVDEIFETIRNVLGSLAARHNLVFEISPGLPEINVDKLRIGQVITNLVENAAKFSKDGSRIRIGVKAEKEQLVFEVEDQGEGMSKEVVANLFNRFYQAERVVSGKTRGTGLGLAICKGIIESHGGKIWVDSRPGQGSVFIFSLPVDVRDNGINDQERRRKP